MPNLVGSCFCAQIITTHTTDRVTKLNAGSSINIYRCVCQQPGLSSFNLVINTVIENTLEFEKDINGR